MPEAPPVTSADIPGLSSIPPDGRLAERPTSCCRGPGGQRGSQKSGTTEESTARPARGADEGTRLKWGRRLDAVGLLFGAARSAPTAYLAIWKYLKGYWS
jgi:hypothetical protein